MSQASDLPDTADDDQAAEDFATREFVTHAEAKVMLNEMYRTASLPTCSACNGVGVHYETCPNRRPASRLPKKPRKLCPDCEGGENAFACDTCSRTGFVPVRASAPPLPASDPLSVATERAERERRAARSWPGKNPAADREPLRYVVRHPHVVGAVVELDLDASTGVLTDRVSASASPNVVCGDHAHGLSGAMVDGSTGCPWCHVERLQSELVEAEVADPSRGCAHDWDGIEYDEQAGNFDAPTVFFHPNDLEPEAKRCPSCKCVARALCDDGRCINCTIGFGESGPATASPECNCNQARHGHLSTCPLFAPRPASDPTKRETPEDPT